MESSENYFTLLASVTEDGSRKPYKRLGSWNEEIAAKKTRPGKIIDEEELSQDLTDDKQPQQLLESPDNNSPILPVESMGNFPNPLSSASDIACTTFQYFSRRSEKRELDPDFLCFSMKKLKLCEFETTKVAQEDGSFVVKQQLISNTESPFLEKSKNLGPVEDPDILDSCASDLVTFSNESNQIKSLENKDQLCSVGNADKNLKENSGSNSDDAFFMLFDIDDVDEPEGFSCERNVFDSNFVPDELSNSELICRTLRDAFEERLQNFPSQTESLDIHQKFDEDEFKNHSKQHIQRGLELDLFDYRVNDTWFSSNAMSEVQCQELETIGELAAGPQMSCTNPIKEKKFTINSLSSASLNEKAKEHLPVCQELETTEELAACPPSCTNLIKEKKCTINSSSASLNEKAKEHLHIGKITKAVNCFKSSSSDKEYSSKQRSDDSEEIQEIPSLLSFIQKSGPETVIKNLTKNKEINILKANQLPSLKKSIPIDPATDHIFSMGMKNVMKSVETTSAELQISGSAGNFTNPPK